MSSYVPIALQRQVRLDAGRFCEYCQSSEMLIGMPLEIEHIIPEVAGGQTVRENLWMACQRCNQFKAGRIQALDPETNELTLLFNPRVQEWSEHFRWQRDGLRIEGLTPCGRATIVALQMNNDFVVEARRLWVIGGWHPPFV